LRKSGYLVGLDFSLVKNYEKTVNNGMLPGGKAFSSGKKRHKNYIKNERSTNYN